MMAVRRYTREELIALSRSKLVSRPDNLPAIEQWIDEQPQASTHERHKSNDGTLGKGRQARAGLAGAVAAEGSPMGAFSTGRPTLTSRGSTLRNASGDDVSLGPPRNMFPSTRNVSKLSDSHDRNGSDATANDESDSVRSRFFSDRQLNRRSGAEKEGSDGKDRWTSMRERRQQGELEDEKRGLSRPDKDSEGDRRNGYGHKDDPRWSREDRPNGTRTGGGWREREAARRDRDHHEKDPEWMDDPVVKKDQELGLTARTQDDFEEWKRQMAGKPKVEKEEAPIPEPVALSAAPAAEQPKATLKLDGFENGFFGFGGASAGATPGASTPSAVATSTGTKISGKGGKTSRFASMFKPVEPDPAPAPEPEEPQPQARNGAGSKTVEDQEGFNRVLAMLGGTKINQPPPASDPPRDIAPSYAEPVPTSPPPPPKSMTSSGTLPGGRKSRFTDVFAQDKNPQRLQSPQQNSPPIGAESGFEGSHRGLPEDPALLFANSRQLEGHSSHQQLPRTQAPDSTMSPAPGGIPFNAMREQQPRPSSGRLNEAYNRFDPPSRSAESPDRNIEDLLAQPRQHSQATPTQSQDLLNLLRNPKSSRPPSQQTLSGSGGIDQAELERWLQQQQPMQTHGPTQTIAPKPRGPQQPPGLFEEQLMRNYGHEQQQRHEQLSQLQERQQPRGPPGFYNPEQEVLFAQQQRHAHQQAEREAQLAQLRRQQQFAELTQRQQMQQQQQQQQPPRRMSGHPALHQMHIPQQHSQPDFHQLSSPGGAGAPPPGFNQMPRYPPGFANVNTFQQAREQAPPGFSSGPMSPPAGLAGGAPPGFFGGPPTLPPGFHAQQIRSPTGEVPGRKPPFDEYGRR